MSFPGAQELLADTLWGQTAKVYRRSTTDVNRLQAVRGLEAVRGRRGPTPNYDVQRALAGQSKENNIMTSDRWKFSAGVDLRSGDVLLIDAEWWNVVGAPTFKSLVPRGFVYLNTTTPPDVMLGYWGEPYRQIGYPHAYGKTYAIGGAPGEHVPPGFPGVYRKAYGRTY